MGKCLGLLCYFCTAKIIDAKHLAFDEEGNVVAMCDPCYDLAEKFFVKGANINEQSRTTDKGSQ